MTFFCDISRLLKQTSLTSSNDVTLADRLKFNLTLREFISFNFR